MTLVVACIVLAGSFIQSAVGFGFTFFSLPLCSLLLDFPVAVSTLVILGQVLNTVVLFQHRWHADWRASVLPMTLFSLPGIPVGVWLLSWLDVRLLQGCLGAVLIFHSLYQMYARPTARAVNTAGKGLAGFIGGILGGALNSQGPPILVYVSLQPWTKDLVKGTIAAFFFTTGLGVLAVQAADGLLTGQVQNLTLWCLPTLLAGTWAGRLAYVRMGEGGYRRLFLGLILALGVMLLGKCVLGYAGGWA
ncbi:sulfite exporter TauE/SafE family protein [Desulfocurvus sp. DL9XJH121]